MLKKEGAKALWLRKHSTPQTCMRAKNTLSTCQAKGQATPGSGPKNIATGNQGAKRNNPTDSGELLTM